MFRSFLGKSVRTAGLATVRRANVRRARPCLEALEDRTLLATNLYVAMTGSDGTGDGSINNPYRSLTKAVAVVATGDTIILRNGDYSGGVLIKQPNVTIQSMAGEWAVINAPINNSAISTTIRFDVDAWNCTLRRLEVTGGYFYTVKTESNWDWGGSSRYGASKLTIEDCKLHDSGRDVVKITPGSDDVVIRRSEIYRSGRRDASNAEGIDNVNGDRMIVQDTYVHDITTTGIYAKGGSIGSIIERNLVMNCAGLGIAVGQDTDFEWFDQAANPGFYENIDGIVRNNVVINTTYAGIGIYAALRPQVNNNTLVNVAKTGQAGILISAIDHYTPPNYTSFFTVSSKDVTVYNNVVAVDAAGNRPIIDIRVGGLSGFLAIDNNQYHNPNGSPQFWDERTNSSYQGGFSGWKAHVQGDAASLVGNPGLDANYHLTATSPGVNRGRTLASVIDDYDGGNARSGTYDIGADELAATPLQIPPPAGVIGTGGGHAKPGTLQFDKAAYSVAENGVFATITVTRTGGSDGTVAVDYWTSNGTAIDGQDYERNVGNLTFGPGQTVKTIVVNVFDDTTNENDETVLLVLANPSNGATLGATKTTTLTIQDNDAAQPGVLQFDKAAYAVAENGGQVTITVTRTNGSDGTVEVDYWTSNGTAIDGQDYDRAVGKLTFGPGQTTKTFVVNVLDDTVDENDETVLLVLANPSNGATLGANKNATLTIQDNDSPGTLQFSTAAYSVWENGVSATITVTRTNGTDGTVDVDYWTSNGTAIDGQDYDRAVGKLTFGPGESVKTFVVNLLDDVVDENDETVLLVLANPSNGATLGANKNATLTIQDNDNPGTLQFDKAAYSIGENGVQATITVTRSNGTDGTVEVDYWTSNGTAIDGEDYDRSAGKLTFGPGQSVKTFVVNVLEDATDENDETVLLVLKNPSNGATLGATKDATITILDNDDPGTLQFDKAAYSIGENGVQATITVTRTNGTAGTVEVDYWTSNGTAIDGEDYDRAAGKLTFGPGQTVKTFVVNVLDDTADENDETVLLVLKNPSNGATLGATKDATITILDNDVPGTLQFDKATYAVWENEPFATITVTRTNGTDGTVEVDYWTSNGTAIDGVDYDRAVGKLTFGHGESVKTLVVNVLDDVADENDETVLLVLANPSNGATLGATKNATLTIQDNDDTAPPGGGNEPPVAGDDTVKLGCYGTVAIDVLANDTDANGDTLVVQSYGQGASGTVTRSADGSLRYTPQPGFTGMDAFTYVLADGQGGEDTGEVSVKVTNAGTTAGIEEDPWNPAQRMLIVRGSKSKDNVLVAASGATQLLVILNKLRFTFDVNAAARIVVLGMDGNDTLRVSGVALNAQIVGGVGNDILVGSNGHDLLQGGAGTDRLEGGNGHDLLIGGTGVDVLVGGPTRASGVDDDLLVAGSTSYDLEHSALATLATEWATTVDRAATVAALRRGDRGLPVLNGSSVVDDADRDFLTGSNGEDWFWGSLQTNVFRDVTSADTVN